MDTSHKLPEDLLLSNDIEPSSPSSSSSMDTSHQQPEDLLNPPTSHLPSNDIEPFFPSSSMGTSDKQSEDLLNPLTSLLPSNNIESSASSSSSMGTSHNQPEDLLNPPTSLIPSHDIESFASSSSMSTSHNQPEDLLNPPTSLIPSHDIESFASSSMGTSHNQPEDLLNPPTSLLLSNDIESFASSFMGTSHNQPDLINLSTPLLSNDIESPSSNPSQQQIPTKTLLFTSILVIFCIALASIAFFVFIFFSSGAPPRIKFNRDIVILISSDGFRFDYKFKTETPNIDRLISGGTEAKMGLIPVFPTLTFPNHYSIVTGLYPAFHGMVNNFFYDPSLGEKFAKQSNDPKWWFGGPLWETVVKNGFNASTYFWPGSEVIKGSWTCPSEFCPPYDDEIPFEHRVDTVLGYFDHRPISEIPALMTLYFEDPDTQGHQYGPDAPQIVEAVARIDNMIGRLIQGLEKRGIFENVTIILVGDHGMAGTSDDRLIILEDLAKWIKIPKDWVEFYGPLLSIRPPNGVSPRDVVAKMNKGLRSGEVENGMHLKVYLKEDLPKRFHYSASDRIAPIIGLVDDGFKALTVKRPERSEFGGTHGYDNSLMSMRTIFVGHGPWFARGYKVKSFENVEIYNMVTTILNITGAPNNGSSSFAKNILLM